MLSVYLLLRLLIVQFLNQTCIRGIKSYMWISDCEWGQHPFILRCSRVNCIYFLTLFKSYRGAPLPICLSRPNVIFSLEDYASPHSISLTLTPAGKPCYCGIFRIWGKVLEFDLDLCCSLSH